MEMTLEGDAVVVGTGLVESIVACSLSRAGKKVLHLDSNDYYGHNSTSASFKEFFTKCMGQLKPLLLL